MASRKTFMEFVFKGLKEGSNVVDNILGRTKEIVSFNKKNQDVIQQTMGPLQKNLNIHKKMISNLEMELLKSQDLLKIQKVGTSEYEKTTKSIDIMRKKLEMATHQASMLEADTTFGTGGQGLAEMFGLEEFTKKLDLSSGLLGRFQSGWQKVQEGGGVIKSLQGLMSGLIVKIKIAAIAFAKFAIPILAILGLVKIFKRVWDANIGGIQTTFKQIVGRLQVIWGKFNVMLTVTLKKFEPLFKIIFQTIGKYVNNTISMIMSIFKGLWSIVSPIIDVFAEIGEVLGDIFGATEKGMGTFSIFTLSFKIFGKTVEWLGKILGFLIKISLKPLVWTFKILGFLLKPVVAIFNVLGVVLKKVGDIFVNVFSRIREFLQPVIDMFSKMFEWVNKLISPIQGIFSYIAGAELPGWLNKIVNFFTGGKKGGKDDDEGEEEKKRSLFGRPVSTEQQMAASGATNNVSNNANVTVNSAGPITPDNAPQIGDVLSRSIKFSGGI